MNICVLTDWIKLSPFFEFSLQLIEALYKLDHETFVLAPIVKDDAEIAPGYEEGKGNYYFDEKTPNDLILSQLLEWKIDALLVHPECMKNKSALEWIVKEFTKKGGKAYCFIHSNNYDKEIPYSAFTALLYPSREFMSPLPAGSIRPVVCPIGMPNYEFDNNPKFREEQNLPILSAEDVPGVKGYYLTTFDGKTAIEPILTAIKYINGYKLVDKPVHLFVQVSDPKRFDYYQQLAQDNDYLYPSLGYLPGWNLAQYFYHSDGAIFIYPETSYRYTSSAIRFAFSTGTPVITNRGNHTTDLETGTVATWSNDTTVESIKHAIVSHFTNVGLKKMQSKRNTQRLLENYSWNKVAPVLVNIIQQKPNYSQFQAYSRVY